MALLEILNNEEMFKIEKYIWLNILVSLNSDSLTISKWRCGTSQTKQIAPRRASTVGGTEISNGRQGIIATLKQISLYKNLNHYNPATEYLYLPPFNELCEQKLY